MTVREPVPVSFFSNVTRDTMDRYYEECAEEVFESVRKVLELAAVRASFVHLKAPDTAEAIAGEAVKVGADLIVAGKRSYADTPHEKGDGTLSSVIAKAQCPVLVLRSDRVPGKGPLRVGIAVDGSRFGYSAVSFIASHLPLFGTGAHFMLIHAVREGLSPEATQEALRSATETLKPLLECHGIEADLMAPQGEVADAVVRAAVDLESTCWCWAHTATEASIRRSALRRLRLLPRAICRFSSSDK